MLPEVLPETTLAVLTVVQPGGQVKIELDVAGADPFPVVLYRLVVVIAVATVITTSTRSKSSSRMLTRSGFGIRPPLA